MCHRHGVFHAGFFYCSRKKISGLAERGIHSSNTFSIPRFFGLSALGGGIFGAATRHNLPAGNGGLPCDGSLVGRYWMILSGGGNGDQWLIGAFHDVLTYGIRMVRRD